MDQKVDRAPFFLQPGEKRVHRFLGRHVAFDHLGHADRIDQRLDPLLQRVALIGKGDFGTLGRQLLGDAPGNGFVIGKAHDEPALACHKSG